MAATIDHAGTVRSVRQLRRVRVFYAGGALLWAVSTAWVGWVEPGSRQMWVSALLLLLFTGLWSVSAYWLARQAARAHRPAPVHHAAGHRRAWRRHAGA
ncbi:MULTISPECIES: hypothetical protein [unclassified Streptomyces]|uniref:hypothetical protein n=1 Tax=unclassified Streptomyces TaxID=2593676 RepID=UPI0038183025